MSTLSVQSRARAKEKVERLTRSSTGDIDASGWREPLGEKGNIQTGPRPVSRQGFKRGGKVAGHAGAMRADRKPRAKGGATKIDGALINTDIKQANESRDGQKHDGGMKRGGHVDAAADKKLIKSEMHKAGCGCKMCHGGRAGKAIGGPLTREIDANRAMATGIRPQHTPQQIEAMRKLGVGAPPVAARPMTRKSGGHVIPDGTRPAGGRLARKGGGRAKKGMNVNIIIAPSQPKPMMPPPGASPPGAGPVGLHQGAPPPVMPPGAAPPPMAPPPMARKDGGGVVGHFAKPGKYPLKDGGGGGKGRLEKIRAYG